MVTVVFPDREMEKRGLVLLLGGFAGRLDRSGRHTISREAVEALRKPGIEIEVKRDDCE